MEGKEHKPPFYAVAVDLSYDATDRLDGGDWYENFFEEVVLPELNQYLCRPQLYEATQRKLVRLRDLLEDVPAGNPARRSLADEIAQLEAESRDILSATAS